MRYTILLLNLLLVSYTSADEPKVADKSNAIVAELLNQVEVLRNQGQAAVARTETLFDEEVAKLKAKAMESLSAEMDAAIEAKDLDRAVALRGLVKKVEELNAGDVTEATIVVSPEKEVAQDENAIEQPTVIAPIVGDFFFQLSPINVFMELRFNRNGTVGRIRQGPISEKNSLPYRANPETVKPSWQRVDAAWICNVFWPGQPQMQRIIFNDSGEAHGWHWSHLSEEKMRGVRLNGN